MCRIELAKVFHSYGERLVLRGVDLQIESGECAVLVGKNGAGKSTLLKLVAGLLSPERGKVSIEGKSPRQIRKERVLPFGVALQESFLYSDLTVHENLAFALGGSRETSDGLKNAEIISRFELEPYLSLPVKNASQGIAQKVSLARCFLRDNRFLLLDEPFAHLDSDSRQALKKTLEEARGKGTTILCVVHDLDLMEALPHRRYELHHGEVRAQ